MFAIISWMSSFMKYYFVGVEKENKPEMPLNSKSLSWVIPSLIFIDITWNPPFTWIHKWMLLNSMRQNFRNENVFHIEFKTSAKSLQTLKCARLREIQYCEQQNSEKLFRKRISQISRFFYAGGARQIWKMLINSIIQKQSFMAYASVPSTKLSLKRYKTRI